MLTRAEQRPRGRGSLRPTHLARYLANGAVRRYAEAHQDPVLKRASAYLTTLTDGAYVRAGVTEDSKKTTLLSAITAKLKEQQIHELSGGERDALYLSLRLAALEAAIERTGPLPIILDDVLVNLDEDHSSTDASLLRWYCGDLPGAVVHAPRSHRRPRRTGARQRRTHGASARSRIVPVGRRQPRSGLLFRFGDPTCNRCSSLTESPAQRVPPRVF